ncbi:MAG: sulfatase [Acidobacteriota bacterium]
MSSHRKDLLITSLWFGLFAGILEAAAKTIPRLVPGWHTDSPIEILWIAPVFNLVLFLALGAGLAVVSRLIPAVNVRLALALFVAVIFFGVLFSLEVIGKFPSLILALGIGVQSGRSVLGREQIIIRSLRGTLPVLLISTLALAVTGAAWPRWRESRSVAQLPASRPGPNIILMTADTLRADNLSAYGYSRQTTPFLDRLSQNSAVFEAAFANSSWTLPSHASLFTGRLPQEHQADWKQPLASRFPTLAQVLSAVGYLTAAFVANREYLTPEWGLNRGFAHFEILSETAADYAVRTVYGKRLALNLLPRLGYFDIPGRKRASQVNDEFLRWLDKSEHRPFFVFLNYMDVHDPYLTEAGYSTRFSHEPCTGDVINFQFGVTFRRKPNPSPAEIQREIDGYDAALAYLDSQLERLFNQLQARRLLDNTIVIFTSDHGEAFGNHNLFGHGNSLYREALHVPFLIYWSGRIPPRRLAKVVGLSQVPATVMDLLERQRSLFLGESLAPFLIRKEAEQTSFPVCADLRPGRFRNGPDFYPNSREGWSSLVTDDWHLLVSDRGKTELYAWRQDPDETRNLAADPAKQGVIEQLRQQLQKARLAH